MPVVKKTTMIFALMTLTIAVWVGCSDNTIVRYVDNPGQSNSTEAVETYFPLNTGYITIYNVTYQSGGSEQVTFESGKTISVQGVQTREWIGRSFNTQDTGYFYASGTALYYYPSKSAQPEKILQLPLSNGTTWQTNDINSNDYTDIITGHDGDSTDSPGTNSKDFPIATAVNFTVNGVESIQLATGNSYSQAVKISTPNGTRMNYYWYAPGVGLVRYVIGATDATYPDGDIVGEIVNYGY